VFTTRCELDLYIQFRLFLVFKGFRHNQGEFANYEPSGNYMYRQLSIQQIYILPTPCIYVFCLDLRTNSDYFAIQH